jgi:hypothetical protein
MCVLCIYVVGVLWKPHAYISILRVLLVQVRVAAMLRLSVAWVTCRYSQVGEYYYYSSDKMMEIKWWPDRDKEWVIGGCNKLCPSAMELSLVTMFFLSMSIEDRPLLWMVVGSQTYYPEHILAYGSGKARCSLVVGFWLFLDRLIGGGEMWSSKHHIEAGSQVWELGVQVWIGT